MMESKKIGDSEFSIKWLEEVITKEIGTKASIVDFSFTEVEFGRGMLSQVLIVRLTWDTESDRLPASVALKIPTLKQFEKFMERMPADDPFIKQFKESDLDNLPIPKAHKCEVAVYDLFRSHPPPGLKIPKSYFGRIMKKESQGVLVLEDLSSGIGTTFADGLNKEQMMEVSENIARLHAFSLTTDVWKRDDINLNFESFQHATMPTPHEMVTMYVPKMKEEYPDLFDPLADKCLEFCQSMDDVVYIYRLNDKMNLPDVLCNGDLHVQNMMWVKGTDEKASNDLIALIDWQISHPGNIGEDFARLFTSSVPAPIRRNHYLEILKYYYECLTKFLGSKPPYSFDQVLESYKRCFKCGVLTIVVAFFMIVKQPEMLGENSEEKKAELLERAKGLIEDMVVYEGELGGY